MVGEVEQRRSLLSATVLIGEHLRRCCVTTSAGTANRWRPQPDSRVRVRVAAPMALSIAEKLAGWGAAVEVLEPEPVRAELARLGAELVARYGPA